MAIIRDSKYLGRIKVLRAAPDRAVGEISAMAEGAGRPQKGDRVLSNLEGETGEERRDESRGKVGEDK